MGMNECREGGGGNVKMCKKRIDRMAYCMNWFNYICSAFYFLGVILPLFCLTRSLNHPQPVHSNLVILENQSLPSNL